MKILTDKSFNDAIKLCQENKRYKVLIVTQYAKDHDLLLDYLHQIGADVTRCFGTPWAKFSNGSVIRMMTVVNNTTCCQRASLVLCQAEVFNESEEIRCILEAMEVGNINFKLPEEINNNENN